MKKFSLNWHRAYKVFDSNITDELSGDILVNNNLVGSIIKVDDNYKLLVENKEIHNLTKSNLIKQIDSRFEGSIIVNNIDINSIITEVYTNYKINKYKFHSESDFFFSLPLFKDNNTKIVKNLIYIAFSKTSEEVLNSIKSSINLNNINELVHYINVTSNTDLKKSSKFIVESFTNESEFLDSKLLKIIDRL